MSETAKVKILLVDDRPANLLALEGQLAGPDVEIVTAEGGDEALGLMLAHEFALVLLDVQMPGMDGFETARLMKQAERTKYIPIIFVTAISKERQHVFKGYEAGAVDYLFKPLDPDILKSKVAVFLDLYKQKQALKAANLRILEQQESVIEEERLKVLLQMAGATSHELNQPLMALLGSIEIMRLDKQIPEPLSKHIDRIDAAGRRITQVVKKMSTIRQVEPKPYPGGGAIINLDQTIRILYVEDSDEDYQRFKSYLAALDNTQLSRAASIANAMSILETEAFDLIFVDYLLPGGTGLDFLHWLEKERLDIPVISVTGHGDEVVATNMIKAGAYDYLPKAAIDQNILSRSIFKALEKYKLKKEIAQANAKMARMATRDPLTGLCNRHTMNDLLEKEFSRARRYGTDLACLLMDLDCFKEVNDTYGHHFGDHVLKQFGRMLMNNLRDTDSSFRYGGEEFLVLLPNTGLNEARQAAEKIRSACESETYDDREHAAAVTVSIGVATVSDADPASARDLLTLADKALYRAKSEGRNRVVICQHDGWTAKTDDHFSHLKERLTAIMEKTKKRAVESLELMVLNRDGDRYREHNRRVVQYFNLIGHKLNFKPSIVKTLKHAAIFHDATKILLGDVDQAEELDEKRAALVFDHPCKLRELIEPFDVFAQERSVLLWHHEHFDGNGYPDGLAGDGIPLRARIFSIVDAFVAMTSQRPYRRQFTHEEAVQELAACAGTQFDPHLVDVFIEALSESDAVKRSGETAAKTTRDDMPGGLDPASVHQHSGH
jgi:two-component system cell cycle response regulator